MAGDQAPQFEGWYKKIDPSGSGTIQAGPAAGFLKKSGLNDNILSRVSAKRETVIMMDYRKCEVPFKCTNWKVFNLFMFTSIIIFFQFFQRLI